MTKIAMLSTGEEVLLGDIDDTNASWLSSEFYQQGYALNKRSTVGDKLSSLVEEMLSLSFNHDVVIVNGGLGPTSDDITAEAAAVLLEQELVLFDQWLEVLEERYKSSGKIMPESNVKQAMLPESSVLIDNPIGTACGFMVEINDARVYFTPGVPSEFKLMVSQQILPDVKEHFPVNDEPLCSRLYTFGLSESGISDVLDKFTLPAGFEFGYRSYLPFIEIKLFGPKSANDERLQLMKLVYQHLQQNVVSIDKPMLKHVVNLVEQSKATIAVAEQSTGGWLTSWLHSDEALEPYFQQSWFLSHTLDNSLKEKDTLASAFALAGATREKCGVEIAVVTGQCENNQFSVAISTSKGEWGRVMAFSRQYSRENQRMLISTLVVDMMRRYLEGKAVFAEYSSLKSVRDMHIPAASLAN